MLNWGIIGAGGIAYVFCNAMRFSKTGQLVAVASRDESRANKFATDFTIPRQYTSYEALLADEGVDAVYISTIHPHHAEWVIKAAADSNTLKVETVAPPEMPAGKVCELWVTPPGGAPVSLGRLPNTGTQTLSIPPALNATSTQAEITVSIEDERSQLSSKPSGDIVSTGRWIAI